MALSSTPAREGKEADFGRRSRWSSKKKKKNHKKFFRVI